MKHRIIGFFFLSVLAFLTGCNNWLDVKPATEALKKDMLSNQSGFRDALTGAYIRMKGDALYGGSMMWGTIEHLAQHWKVDAANELVKYSYKNGSVEGEMRTIYATFYSTIADVNSILEQIDANKGCFQKGWYELIKGEALAIRAYCHLDLLRLWGPMPGMETERKILPYVKNVSIDYHFHNTWKEYIGFLQQDLDEAEALLKEVDPILQYSLEALNKPGDKKTGFVPADNYWGYRQIRFNYYAVLALKARFYLWTGNREQAYNYAGQVIRAKDASGEPMFRLGAKKEMTNNDFAFTCEHICALNIYNLKEIAEKKFAVKGEYHQSQQLLKEDLFDIGTTDMRFQLWTEIIMSNQERRFVIKKFWQPEKEGAAQVPLIRLSELYFILIECGTLEEANRYYREFCIARENVPVELNEGRKESVLLKEYNKEFYAEGQLFFQYKRLACEEILWTDIPGNEQVYVVPLPWDEISYGN